AAKETELVKRTVFTKRTISAKESQFDVVNNASPVEGEPGDDPPVHQIDYNRRQPDFDRMSSQQEVKGQPPASSLHDVRYKLPQIGSLEEIRQRLKKISAADSFHRTTERPNERLVGALCMETAPDPTEIDRLRL
ncbi:MAG: hypothetical protein AB1744_05620, partial [Candidatus Zixiibacteriota bacterium]